MLLLFSLPHAVFYHVDSLRLLNVCSHERTYILRVGGGSREKGGMGGRDRREGG